MTSHLQNKLAATFTGIQDVAHSIRSIVSHLLLFFGKLQYYWIGLREKNLSKYRNGKQSGNSNFQTDCMQARIQKVLSGGGVPNIQIFFLL